MVKKIWLVKVTQIWNDELDRVHLYSDRCNDRLSDYYVEEEMSIQASKLEFYSDIFN